MGQKVKDELENALPAVFIPVLISMDGAQQDVDDGGRDEGLICLHGFVEADKAHDQADDVGLLRASEVPEPSVIEVKTEDH